MQWETLNTRPPIHYRHLNSSYPSLPDDVKRVQSAVPIYAVLLLASWNEIAHPGGDITRSVRRKPILLGSDLVTGGFWQLFD